MPVNGDPTVWARFDDMPTDTAQLFTGVRCTLVAWQPSQVAPEIAAVDHLTTGGTWAFGFVAYEAAPGINPALPTRAPAPGLPLAWFALCDPPTTACAVTLGARVPPSPWRWTHRWSAAQYQTAVAAIRRRIAAGDTYQCNLTTRLTAPIAEDPEILYARLATAQQGAHHAYLDTGAVAIACASPELFFELRGEHLLMRPMKGTAARGRTMSEDAAALTALCSSIKDRAENVMIVDLLRNDLGRIAATGSVRVTALCRPERYGTVHQLTSDVRARLRPGCGLVDVFRALFPCGSVTGAPKASSMGIIAELEDDPRGVYCGAVGIVAPPGTPVRAQINVAIRTAVVDRATRTATYGTGGAVTWSSDPAGEYAEALTKTAVLHARPAEKY